MKNIYEKYLGEAKVKWENDPYSFREELAKKLDKFADEIRDISISETAYYRKPAGTADRGSSHRFAINKKFAILDNAISKLESEIMKMKKIKEY